MTIQWRGLKNQNQLKNGFPLQNSWYKINFDTAIRKSYSAQAAVCRNQHGHIIQMMSE
jgi:hypothetical protein